jgi:hypothetical protein
MENQQKFFSTTGGQITIIAICYAITLLIVLVFPNTLGAILALICVFFGWKTLACIQSTYFIWMPIIGWIIYFFVKIIIAYIIGLFVAPYQIGNKIFESIK